MERQKLGFVRNSENVEALPMPGGARIRWLITHKDGAPTFSMRLIEVEKGKSTPHHSHDYEHEIFVVSGSCSVKIGDSVDEATAGDYIFIPPNIPHGMTATENLKIICVVPVRAAREILGE